MSKAIAYILNPEKTDEKLLVSSYGCASETAAREFEWTRKIAEQKGMNPVRIIARHVIQSFEIGEVTPELAHEIGKQFADEILGGKYEYVLTMWLVMKVVGRTMGRIGIYFIQQQKNLADLNSFVEEMVNGQKVIKVFNHEEKAKEQLSIKNKNQLIISK